MNKLTVAVASTLALAFIPVATANAAVSSETKNSIVAKATTTTGNAQSATKLDRVKTKSDTAVKNRLAKLDVLKAQINASRFVTVEHKSGLLAEVDIAATGLTELNVKIQAATDPASAATDAKKIVVDYRVYVLEAPKVHEVLAIDSIDSAVTKLETLSPTLAAAVAAQEAKGVDVTAAKAALVDFDKKTAAIKAKNAGLASPVLSLEPSGYPTNKSTIKNTRTSISEMREDIKAIKANAETVKASLKTKP